ncbi:MAG: sigma-70 family RNA polymerase sigma factor [Acidimicrobiia bacterium]
MDDLCERLAKDLDAAFPDLVRGLRNDMYSGLRSLAGADAEDLTQETFIRAYRALSDYEPDRIRQIKLKGWIWTIALNLGRNHLRARSRRPTLVDAPSELAVNDPEFVDLDAWRQRLGALTPRTRRAVVLRHVVGLAYEDIAIATGNPIGTVKSDVHRGLERLRQELENENERTDRSA